ncbi:MAG: transporter substrate-binding domain-containing protein [Clostridiaceae bacterium]|nr:transporter substrate-binding domain-containing protein [Clostridiaceae bacterium]MDY5991758.1 transporter substrate-binding domain-containing protein [Oscillospiraceae bacterium]
MSKKIIALVLAVLVAAIGFVFVACNGNEEPTTSAPADSSDTSAAAADSDLEYVKNKGKLVVGITEFEPMDYKDKESGKWVGFDADLATAFAKELGVEVEFVEIVWDNKIIDLNGKNIDCVWNGMTLTDDVKAAMETSKAYCNNAQVVVLPADKVDSVKTVEDCKKLTFAVENGSAGKKMAEANGFKFTEVEKQSDALTEVASGTSDAAIIDSLMAGAMVGEGTGFATLKTTDIKLNSEEYGVGFRKGSDLAAKLNDFFAKSLEDGSMEKLAETYGVQEALIK